MQQHEIIQVRGCITQERYIKGKSMPELERLLGLHKGRLANGAVVAVLLQIPTDRQFNVLGYSQVAEHHFNSDVLKSLDEAKLKQIVINDAFTLVGNKRLVKVIPNIPHNDQLNNDAQYPPGLGVPQWKLTDRVSARVVSVLQADEVYS